MYDRRICMVRGGVFFTLFHTRLCTVASITLFGSWLWPIAVVDQAIGDTDSHGGSRADR